jgi:hypothetical protein
MASTYTGEFWLTDAPQIALSGTLRVGPGIRPTVIVEGHFHPMEQLCKETTHPDGSVSREFGPGPANERPITVHGTADDGTPLTLLEALTMNRSGPIFGSGDSQQQFMGIQGIVGIHASGRDHRFDGMRCRVQTAPSWAPRADDEPTEHSLADGVIRANWNDDGVWLEASDRPALSIRMWDRAVTRPTAILLELASGSRVGIIDLQVRERDGMWCSVYSESLVHGDRSYPGQALIEAHDFTLAHLVAWLDRADLLGPLAPVVVDAMMNTGTLETQVLTLASVAEGLHRRLHPGSRRMTVLAAARVRTLIVNALKDVEANHVAVVRGLLGYLEEPGYRRRLLEVAADTRTVVPKATGKTAKWASMITDARNDFAHRIPTGWLTDDDVDKYLCAAYSLRWLLRVRLLQEAGFPDALLRERVDAAQGYGIFLEHAAEWQPSIYAN